VIDDSRSKDFIRVADYLERIGAFCPVKVTLQKVCDFGSDTQNDSAMPRGDGGKDGRPKRWVSFEELPRAAKVRQTVK